MSSLYEQLKELARRKRVEHNVETSSFGLRKVREIYKADGIVIDSRKLPPAIRAVYMCDGGDPSVLVNKQLPAEPRLFSLVHELKHHYCDQSAIENGEIRCGDYNANRTIEIGAEVFAAEFIYPEREFLSHADELGFVRNEVSAEDLVRFKKSCGAPVSYKFIQKRFELLGYIAKGQFGQVQFHKLEEQIYGVPIYKRRWFKRRRESRVQ
jgi:Zn-dependent peptidase ImmA (M78 family)